MSREGGGSLLTKYFRAYEVNVVGTRNVINACLRAGVTRLVYTSSVCNSPFSPLPYLLFPSLF
jgi:nucleoside-diphosphate-sugar epimerase